MSIIDFNCNIKKCDKTIEEINMDYYNSNKDSLPFHINDNVKIKLDDCNNEDMIKIFKDKVFKIIGINLDYDIENPVSYILNTGIDIKLFKDKYLSKA